MDPLAEKYFSLSPYNYVANHPINAIDPDGRDLIFRYSTRGGNQNLTYKDGAFYHFNGKKYDTNGRLANGGANRYLTALQTIENSSDNVLKNQLRTLVESDIKHIVQGTTGRDSYVKARGRMGESQNEIDVRIENGERIGTLTVLNFSDEAKSEFLKIEGVPSSDLNLVVHEMRHQYDYDTGNMKDQKKWLKENKGDIEGKRHKSPSEKRAVENENRVRKKQYERTTYGGEKIKF